MPFLTQGPEGEPSAPYGAGKTNWKFLLIVIVLAVIAGGGIYYFLSDKEPMPHGCTMEAYICPDGTAVGRTGPNCEFAECPSLSTPDETASWQTYRNEEYGFEIKYPQFYQPGESIKWTPASQSLVNFSYQETNVLDILVFDGPLYEYELIDNPGGFGFNFNKETGQWFHIDGSVSEFLPQKLDVDIEAYIYKSGDINCAWDWLIIPHPSYPYFIEIINTTCGDMERDYELPDFILDSKQLLSTFKFIDIADTVTCEEWLDSCAKEGEDLCSPCGCRECCDGLARRLSLHPYRNITTNEVVCLENMTAYICVKCGDGVCGKGENWCVCPEDCEKPDPQDLTPTNIAP